MEKTDRVDTAVEEKKGTELTKRPLSTCQINQQGKNKRTRSDPSEIKSPRSRKLN